MMPRQVGKLDKSTIFLLALAAIPVAWLALLVAPLLGVEQTLPGLLEGLLKEIDYESHPIRLIGLSVSNPKEEKEEIKKQWEQLSLEFKEWDD